MCKFEKKTINCNSVALPVVHFHLSTAHLYILRLEFTYCCKISSELMSMIMILAKYRNFKHDSKVCNVALQRFYFS